MDAAPGPLTWRPRLRVLCLHGRCQTGTTFAHKIEKLVTKAESFAEFAFVDGPVELPTQHGDRENTRAWASEEGPVETPAVLEILDSAWAHLGPFDGVMGFSEGARVAHMLCRRSRRAGGEERRCRDELRFALLAGGPAPDPADRRPSLDMRSMHCASDADTVVPLAESRALAAAFQDAELLEHTGGHVVPQRAEDIKRIISFLEARRDEIYPSKSGEEIMSCNPEDPDDEDPRVNQDQRDELIGLEAMLGPEELVRVPPAWPVRLAVRIQGMETAALRFTLPPEYPQAAPCRCEFAAECFSLLAHREELMVAVEAAREPNGFPSVLAMMQGAQQWAEEHAAELAARASATAGVSASPAGDDAEEDADTPADAWWLKEDSEVDEALLEKAEIKAAELVPDAGAIGSGSAVWARECGAGGYGRPWEFVVGLVGKPSAGKSTFFNAATRPERADREASMAPHPFTTIDPNVGLGWFSAPCPSMSLGCESTTQPEHGRVLGCRRRHPLLVKDVAGLVPGAYLGRGRGNAFLNDLVDADSLIHVVDASGRSDREGVDQGSAMAKSTDPLDEIGWVRHEIHLWIFCNVRAKWDSVRRRARMANSQIARDAVTDRLFALFTGYHASRQLVARVYESMGCSLQGIAETVYDWGECELHLFVACFLRARFPIIVALNKVDMPEAADRVAKVQAKLGSSCVPISARAEWWLYEQARKGHLTYEEGGAADSVALASQAPAGLSQQLDSIQSKVLSPYGSTGVLEALSRAVVRRRPVFICPVEDFKGLKGLSAAPLKGATGDSKVSGAGAKDCDTQIGPLATMVMLRPASTVEEAFAALRHEQMLRGDFVRAEQLLVDGDGEHAPGGQGDGSSVKVLRKDDQLRSDAAGGKDCAETRALVLRILTNKKAK